MKLKLCETQVPQEGYSISGFIYDDERNKFPDATFVRTSTIVKIEDNKLHTKSGSVYEIERVALDEWTALCAANQ